MAKAPPSIRLSYTMRPWTSPIRPHVRFLKLDVMYSDGRVRRMQPCFDTPDRARRYVATYYPELVDKENAPIADGSVYSVAAGSFEMPTAGREQVGTRI